MAPGFGRGWPTRAPAHPAGKHWRWGGGQGSGGRCPLTAFPWCLLPRTSPDSRVTVYNFSSQALSAFQPSVPTSNRSSQIWTGGFVNTSWPASLALSPPRGVLPGFLLLRGPPLAPPQPHSSTPGSWGGWRAFTAGKPPCHSQPPNAGTAAATCLPPASWLMSSVSSGGRWPRF